MIIASYLLYHSEPMTIASYLLYHSEPMTIAICCIEPIFVVISQ